MNVLFQTPLKREQLLALPPADVTREVTIAVHRNHSFELVGSVLNVFLGLSRVKASFWYSGYDDSLSFSELPPKADIHLLWLDAARYVQHDLVPWITSRIQELQQRCRGKVLVAWCGAPGTSDIALPDVLCCRCDAILAFLGPKAFDPRLESFAGTRLSNQACLVLARELGTRYIPALLFPPLKVLAIDLDNTLYEGVLAEDGPEGLTPYRELQEDIATLGSQGFMLTLVSKNEEADVRELFATRTDFPLQWGNFTAHACNWKPKADNITALAEKLNIGLDSILFVDDNPGERLHVAYELPDVHILEAENIAEAQAALRYYPRLFKTSILAEDTLRHADILANEGREHLRKHLTPEEYLRELHITLTVTINPVSQSARVAELCNKTNQFILAYKRPLETDIQHLMQGEHSCIITVSLKDKLSDSGLIAVALTSKQDGMLSLDELVISCRALGRGIEDLMVKHMLHVAKKHLHTGQELAIHYTTGPRNKPALDWLQSLTDKPLAESGTVVLDTIPSAKRDGVQIIEDTRACSH